MKVTIYYSGSTTIDIGTDEIADELLGENVDAASVERAIRVICSHVDDYMIDTRIDHDGVDDKLIAEVKAAQGEAA